MHPLIARIHPAFRTAFLAWLLSRGALWLFLGFGSAAPGEGVLLEGLMRAFLDYGEAVLPAGPPLAMLWLIPGLLVEGLMLLAGLSVYRFARSTELPQVAERACWLWFFSPVMALIATDWSLQMAAALGAIALGALSSLRPRQSALATGLAISARPEFLLFWPLLAYFGWKKYRPGKEPAYTPWLAVLTAPLSFVATIGLTWSLGGSKHVSFRGLYDESAQWRTLETLIPASTAEMILFGGVSMALVLGIRYLGRLPRWYFFATLAAGAIALLHTPVVPMAVVALAWALPLVVYLGLATDEPGKERIVLAGFLISYLMLLSQVS